MIAILALLALTAAQPPASPPAVGPAQRSGDIATQLRQQGRVALAGGQIVIERYDFQFQGENVEAVVTRPATAPGRVPGLLLVPGHGRTAVDMLGQAVRFARAGFASVAVSQPGYGGSAGAPDFAGPRTFAALQAAAERFAAEPFVDPARLGIYGYSRGALAAAELATRTDLFKASVVGGGIYDFRTAYDQIGLDGIRENMAAEAGLNDEAVRFRSPIHDLEGLDGPMLVIHGDADANAPPAQATALAARLAALGKPHRLIIVPGGTHGLAMEAIITPATAFFREHLAPQ